MEFLGQFGVAEAGYETGIKWHKLTDLPITTYIGYDGDNYHVFFDCDTSLDYYLDADLYKFVQENKSRTNGESRINS